MVPPNLALVETLGGPILMWSTFFLINFKLRIYETESKSGQQSFPPAGPHVFASGVS